MISEFRSASGSRLRGAGIAAAVFFVVALVLLAVTADFSRSTRETPSENEPPVVEVQYRDYPTLRSGYDVVISGARVMDPESGFDGIADIGIIGDTVAAITRGALEGNLVIDATGYVAAPGFIDVTMPSYPSASLYLNIQHWKLSDGVTTALWTHDGWGVPSDVIDPLRNRTHYINWGVGTSINRIYSPGRSHADRLEVLERSVSTGGIAVGASPEYYQWIETEALIDYARIADEHGLWLGLHLRYSRRGSELAGVREAVEIAETSGAAVHIFHINSTGGTYNAEEALELLDEARDRGVRITADVYPYSYWMTYLSSSRFDEGWREGFDIDYSDLFYVPHRRRLDEESFHELRSEGGLTMVPEGTISWEEAILPALQRDWIFIASDGWLGRNPFYSDPFSSHPRGSGTFSTALSLHRSHDIPLMTILRKITLDPARHMEPADPEFRRRGRLQQGAYADITVFDPDIVEGRGTVTDAARKSAGIRAVLVNGRVAYEHGEVLGVDAGRLLNRGL